jgi:uncharacterized membrane protein YfcA
VQPLAEIAGLFQPSDLVILFGGLLGGIIAGLAGFGTALVAMPFWLFVLPPPIAAQVAAACGALGHMQTIHTIWPVIRWRSVGHFIIAGLIGVPIGVLLLPLVPDREFKLGVGFFLIVFCIYIVVNYGKILLWRRRPLGDMTVGFAGGLMGGIAGLSGPLPTAWAMLHDWSRDEKRALFQSFNFTILAVMLLANLIVGNSSWDVARAVAIAFPGTFVGTRIGIALYRRMNIKGFDRLIAALLTLSGLTLIWSNW